MADSILDSVKQSLGLTAEYDVFDPMIIMHINSTFATLTQIGIGPVEGFMIEDNAATWDAFVGADPRLNHVQQYTYAKVRLAFDPPAMSFHVTSLEKLADEAEWRLHATRDLEVTTTVTVVQPWGQKSG